MTNIYHLVANKIYDYLSSEISLPKFYYQFIEDNSSGLLFTLEPSENLPKYYSDKIHPATYTITLLQTKYNHLEQISRYEAILKTLPEKWDYDDFEIILMLLNDSLVQQDGSLNNFVEFNRLFFNSYSQSYQIKLDLLIKPKIKGGT